MRIRLRTGRPRCRAWASWVLAAFFISGFLGGVDSAVYAQGFNPMRSITGGLTRPVLHSVRTVIRPTLGIVRDRAGAITELHPSDNGRFVLAVLGDRTARLWDLTRGRQLGEALAQGVVTAAFHSPTYDSPSEDRRAGPEVIALRTDGSLVMVRPDGTIQPTGRRIDGLDAGAAAVLSADGSTVAYRTTEDGWQWMAWRDGRVRPLPDAARDAQPVLSRTGERVAYRTARGPWVVRDARDEGRDGPITLGRCARGTEVATAAFAPDAGRVVFGDERGNLCVWRLSGPSPRRLFVTQATSGAIRTLALHREGALVTLAGEPSEIAVWSLATRSRVVSWESDAAPSALLLDAERGWVLAGRDAATIGLWSIDERARLARLISLRRGWAVVGRRGRFDGSRNGFDAVVWAAKEQTLPIDAFSERYFEPGLLAKLDDAAPLYLNADVRDVAEDGYVRPPVVSLDPLASRDADAQGRLPVTVRVTGKARESGIELRLYHNGKLIPAPAAGSPAGVARYWVSLLPGENRFEAVGVSPGGVEGRPVSASITAPGSVPRAVAMHVVAVGIDDYRNSYLFSNLGAARNDAETIARTLEDGGRGLFKEVSTKPLLDASASVFDIEHHILRAFPSDHDILVVYLAGHGYAIREGEGWEWYFLPFTNAWRGAVKGIGGAGIDDLVRRHGLSSRQLMKILTEAGPRRVFLVLDSCYSGAAVETLSTPRAAEVNDAVTQKSLRRLGRVGGIHVLAATRSIEEVVGKEVERKAVLGKDELQAAELATAEHGALTYLVLEGIRESTADEDHDERVSVQEIIDYAAREMPLLSEQLDENPIAQKPVGYSRGEDFVLAGR